MRDLAELKMKQSLPLDMKIRLTQERVRQWINEFGEDWVYISFGGGKDSTVLLDLVRNRFGYKNVEAVFFDTGLEYPEIREFVKTFDNVTWLKPKMNFKAVIEKYGYPFISKEVSGCVGELRSWLDRNNLTWSDLMTGRQTDRQHKVCFPSSGLNGNTSQRERQKQRGISESEEWDYP